MAPEKHALLSASSSHRWLNCTRCARLEETLPEKTSSSAEEGRLAHAIAELKVRKAFVEPIGPKKFSAAMKKLTEDPIYDPEMQSHTDTYLEYITELAMRYPVKPYVMVEQEFNYERFAPEGYGTSDCALIGGSTLHIVDFKYGKNPQFEVSAEHNPQMMLYALGALEAYDFLYSIDTICLTIVQPRLNSISEWSCTREELLDWGVFVVKPRAQMAFAGEGEFAAGDWCGFCRAKSICTARAGANLALEDFGQRSPDLLTNKEVGSILARAKELARWANDVEEWALAEVLRGEEVPGWKAVEGRRNRAFTDTDKAFEICRQHGIEDALLYVRKPVSLTGVEGLLGKKEFKNLLSDYVIKPPGKPTLALESDKRPPYHPVDAAADFAEQPT